MRFVILTGVREILQRDLHLVATWQVGVEVVFLKPHLPDQAVTTQGIADREVRIETASHTPMQVLARASN